MIVVAGEALYDLVLQSPSNDLRGHPGGAAFNAARTIGRLEQPVAYLGRVSTDTFGTRLQGMLERDGVGLDSMVSTDDPTTLALAEVDHEEIGRASCPPRTRPRWRSPRSTTTASPAIASTSAGRRRRG